MTALGNITAVGWSLGDDTLGNPGWGRTPNTNDKPTFYAVTANGSTYAWGNNRLGALGDGLPVNAMAPPLGTGTPRQVVGLPPVLSVVGRQAGALALDREGKVWSWGQRNEQSLLLGAAGTGDDYATPRRIDTLFNRFGPVQQIQCGAAASCGALTRSGRLLLWGFFGNGDGTKGAATAYDLFPVTEVPLPANRRVTYLGASENMVYALLDDGRLVVFPGYPTAPKFIDTRQVLPAAGGTSSVTCSK